MLDGSGLKSTLMITGKYKYLEYLKILTRIECLFIDKVFKTFVFMPAYILPE